MIAAGNVLNEKVNGEKDNFLFDGFMKGGSLGLFIGFSFFALWDIFVDFATVGILSPK